MVYTRYLQDEAVASVKVSPEAKTNNQYHYEQPVKSPERWHHVDRRDTTPCCTDAYTSTHEYNSIDPLTTVANQPKPSITHIYQNMSPPLLTKHSYSHSHPQPQSAAGFHYSVAPTTATTTNFYIPPPQINSKVNLNRTSSLEKRESFIKSPNKTVHFQDEHEAADLSPRHVITVTAPTIPSSYSRSSRFYKSTPKLNNDSEYVEIPIDRLNSFTNRLNKTINSGGYYPDVESNKFAPASNSITSACGGCTGCGGKICGVESNIFIHDKSNDRAKSPSNVNIKIGGRPSGRCKSYDVSFCLLCFFEWFM